MHVGVCTVTLRLPGNDNLKGKRRAIQSLATRVRAKFNVSIAEVDDLDSWQQMTLGIACVSNEGRHVNSMLSNVVQYIERIGDELAVELLDYKVEILEGV